MVSSLAVHWIKAEIHGFILKNWRIVKVATTSAENFSLIYKRKKKLEWLSQDEAKAIADLDVELKDIMEMEMRLSSAILHLIYLRTMMRIVVHVFLRL